MNFKSVFLSSKTLKALQRALSSHQPEGTTEVIRPRFYKLKAHQKKYTQDDGVPIHLKGGTKDKILYKLTFLGCIVGCSWGFKTIVWDMSLQKWLNS